MGTELLEKEDASMNARNVNSVSCVNATSMSGKASAVFFAYVNAFRFYSFGVFYYFYFGVLKKYPQRTCHGVA